MALTVNTNIINDTDQYLLDAKNVKGTYVVVANTTERDGLPAATRVEGTLVYCQADDKFYMYNGSSWVEKNYLTTDSSIAFGKLPTGTTASTVAIGNHTHSNYATKSEITSAMIYKGTVNSTTTLPAAHTVGWVYRVGEAGTYAGESCQVGDMIICITTGTSANNAHWEVVETNDNGHVVGPASAVDGRIAVFDKTSGKLIKDSGYSTGSFSSASHTHSYTAPPSATASGGTPTSTNTGAATGAGTSNAASTTSVGTGITASDSGHKHSVGAHSHGLNSHKHSVGAHSHGLNNHTHSVTAFNVSVSGTTLTFTTVSSTEGASGSTANSTAFDSGAASGSTANSTAFDSGSSTATITISDSGHSHGYTAPASHTHTYDKMSAHTHSITGTSATTGGPS